VKTEATANTGIAIAGRGAYASWRPQGKTRALLKDSEISLNSGNARTRAPTLLL
jgi:hypothetical protein